MKLHLIVPPLVVAALAAACSKETSAPVSTAVAAESASAAPQANAAASQTEGLSELADQLTAEEIQARREAWVSGGPASGSVASSGTAQNSTASSGDAATPRVAAAPAPSREQ